MPQLDESARLNDDAPRCPSCAKRISADATNCPACGYELLPRRTRIRCKRCGSRIPADATVCPRCKNDPHKERIPPILVRGVAIGVGIVLLICVGWIIFRAFATNTLVRALNLNPPTAVPTRVIQVIHVVASPIPPTPTQTATITPTPTSRFSPTPTKRGAKTATPAISATPPLPPGFYPMPQLLAPANTTVYTGANANILLEWAPVSPNTLRENEWYEIKLNYTARNNTPGEYRYYTKETRWKVQTDRHVDLSPDARTVKWIVTVVRAEGLDLFASLNRAPISAPSAARVFIWN
ncbi:MAG: zinc ribbon domain-containing protein [Anaerolineales bacterium]|nr:zinc ribbon domain-containing protein [Anaerolineales bacterium]